jgi:hypothetical protein
MTREHHDLYSGWASVETAVLQACRAMRNQDASVFGTQKIVLMLFSPALLPVAKLSAHHSPWEVVSGVGLLIVLVHSPGSLASSHARGKEQ